MGILGGRCWAIVWGAPKRSPILGSGSLDPGMTTRVNSLGGSVKTGGHGSTYSDRMIHKLMFGGAITPVGQNKLGCL